MSKKLLNWIILVICLTLILFIVSLFSLCIGAADISLNKIISLLFTEKGTEEYSIIFQIRLPRILLAIAIGGALSLSGVILQGMFRNPLVEPYTLGISGGAAVGVCLNIILRAYQRIGSLSFPLSGFIGAITVIFILYLLTAKRAILRIQQLLLTGVMISFLCSATILLIMSVARIEDLHGIVFWIMGSLQEPNWTLIKLSILISVSGLIIVYFFWANLNALCLGEEEAHHLGINVEKTKRALFLIASLLTGSSVSIAGIIGFVGLAVPHIVRMIFGYDHRITLISAFFGGASFLILCDTLARTIIAPLELPVGVITGIVGGSIFIYALTKRQVRC